MSLLVLGTDTGVGKTVTCALLLQRWATALDLAYWKPIATGGEDDRDSQTIRELCTVRCEILPETYLLRDPLSPHLAARREGIEIDPDLVLADLARHRERRRGLVVEGAGGFHVPLTDWGYLQSDLVARMDLPVLLVARSTLGTINHTLLTLEALRARHVKVHSVGLVGPRNAENRAAVERFGKVNIAFELDLLSPLLPETLARAANRLDPQGDLPLVLRRTD